LGYSQINIYKNIYLCKASPELDSITNKTFSLISSLKTIEDNSNKILVILSKKPGLKAREIAGILNIDKTIVNSILYGKLKEKCQIDGNFFWYLKKDCVDKKSKKLAVSKIELLKKAVGENISIQMIYKGFNRIILPYSVNNKYCVGFCTLRNDLRTFRIDRMREISMGDNFEPNRGFFQKAEKQVDEAQYYKKKYY